MTKRAKTTNARQVHRNAIREGSAMMATLIQIANRHLLRDLTTRNSDREDFREICVDNLRDALIAAYKAGRDNAKR